MEIKQVGGNIYIYIYMVIPDKQNNEYKNRISLI
jgi:hypothetical protein